MLAATSGITSFFSFLYKPGATKAHNWYRIQGSANAIEASTVTLIGTRNGDTTPTAIILEPSGKALTKGIAK